MKSNMGNTDRIIRTSVAILIVVLYYFGIISGTTANVLGVFAIIFVLTSMVSFCPLYTVIGVNTCSRTE